MEQKGDQFPRNLGTVITMKTGANTANHWTQVIQGDESYKAFSIIIPHAPAGLTAAQFDPNLKTFGQKYPGNLGNAITRTAEEFWGKL